MNKTTVAATAVAAALVLYLIWNFIGAPLAVASTPNGGNSIDQRLERIISAQEIQNQRLDRLESVLASTNSRTRLPGAVAGVGGRSAHATESELPLTAAQQEQMMQTLLGQMESKFASEPYSAVWASGTEKLIDSAFSAGNLAYESSPRPISHESQCRSDTCRVRVVYKDDAEADIGQQFLLTDIAARLPKAKLLRITRPDGTVEVIAFARTRPAHR